MTIWQHFKYLMADQGGWIQFLPAIAGALGSLFGGAGKASSDSRMQQNMLAAQKDQTEVSKYGIAQGAEMDSGQLDLQRKGFTEDARGNRAKQAALADMLMGFQPQRVNVPGVQSANISGGLSLGEGGKAGMAEMLKQALAAQMQGDTFTGGKMLQAPTATPYQQAGLMEKILGIGGLVGSGIAGVAGAIPKGYTPPTPGLGNGLPGQVGQNMGMPQIPQSMTASAGQGLNPELLRHLFSGN